MKWRVLPLLTVAVVAALLTQLDGSRLWPAVQESTRDAVPLNSGRLLEHRPLQFERNQGQADDAVRFLAHGSGYNLFLTSNEALVTLPSSAADRGHRSLSLHFTGASAGTQLVGLDALPGTVNYYLGRDPAQWQLGVPTYARVRYQQLYPGIDLVFYGQGQQLEFDFVVAPGVDPDQIAVVAQSADSLQIDDRGDLLLSSEADQLRLNKPYIYQEIDGIQHQISGQYALKGESQFGFKLAAYDTDYPLIIDPVLEFSSYFGGAGHDYGNGIALDQAGNIYITGSTTSTDFPVANPAQPGFGGGGVDCPSDEVPYRLCYDAFVSKFNASGTNLIYSTYIGLPGDDEGHGIAVDSAGNAYMTGMMSVNSDSLPDMYIYKYILLVKLNASGGFVYGGWFGSNGSLGRAIAVDAQGRAYLTGETTGAYPTTPDAIQPEPGELIDAFVAVFDPTGSGLEYSTYLGGNQEYCNVCYSTGNGIAVDSAGLIYVTGQAAPSFPTTANAFQRAFDGFWNAFVVKIDRSRPGPTGLVYASYLGGGLNDFGKGIALDASGKVYVTGSTNSDDFPTTAGAYDRSCGTDGICNTTQNQVCDWVPPGMPPVCHLDSKADFFVAKLDLSRSGPSSLIYATYVGGSGKDEGNAIAVDGSGNAYVAGATVSPDFPVVSPVQPDHANNLDAAVIKLNAAGAGLDFSTFLGGGGDDAAKGVAIGPTGSVYAIGYTGSVAFPVHDPYQPRAGGWEAFIARLDLGPTMPPPNPNLTPRQYLPALIK